MTKIDVAVVGIGGMGRHHARIYNKMPDANLVAICDLDLERCAELTVKYGCTAYADYEQMITEKKPRAVSVCTPATTHYPIVKNILPSAHVLVEKPLTAIYENALILRRQAIRLNRVLLPGHVLRFKPILDKLFDLLSSDAIGEVYHVSFVHHGKFDGRGGDVGIVMDVGVHYCDLLYYIYPSLLHDSLSIQGIGGYGIRTTEMDYYCGTLRSKNTDLTASFDFNRTETTKRGGLRQIEVFGRKGKLQLDWSKKGILKNHTSRYYPLHEQDALEAQLSEFLGKVMGVVDKGRIDLINGVNAVSLAKRLEHATLGGFK